MYRNRTLGSFFYGVLFNQKNLLGKFYESYYIVWMILEIYDRISIDERNKGNYQKLRKYKLGYLILLFYNIVRKGELYGKK